MPYALFVEDAQISKPLPKKSDVLEAADEAGLVVDVVTDDKPKRLLDEGLEIKACE